MRASAGDFDEVYLHFLKNGLGLTLLSAVHKQAMEWEQDSVSSQGKLKSVLPVVLGKWEGARDSGFPWEGIADVTEQGMPPG